MRIFHPARLSFEAKRFVFIGGLHRSGTTFLAECLGRHSAISSFKDTGANENEGQYLQTVYPDDNKYGGPGRFAFDRRCHLDENSHLISSSTRERIFHEWSPYWDLERPYLLEKTPGNMIKARFLQALFPASYFIVILRHPVAVSLATQRWSGTSIYSLIHHWIVAHELLRNDLPFLERYLIIKYENLVDNFEAEITRIFEFLKVTSEGIDILPQRTLNADYFSRWNAASVGRGEVPRTRKKQRSILRKIYNRLLRPLIMADLSTQGWEFVDFASDVHDAITVFEGRIREFGYSLSNLGTTRVDYEGSEGHRK